MNDTNLFCFKYINSPVDSKASKLESPEKWSTIVHPHMEIAGLNTRRKH